MEKKETNNTLVCLKVVGGAVIVTGTKQVKISLKKKKKKRKEQFP